MPNIKTDAIADGDRANLGAGWRANAAWFLCGQALSVFGSLLTGYAIMWYITLRTNSGAAMAIYAIASIFPMFFATPFGGVWADRHNRKHIINLADACVALVSLITALIMLFGFKDIWLLLVCAALRSAAQGVHTPAIGSFIPQITPPEQLERINGINGSIQSFAMIFSPMASAALLSVFSLEIIFFIDVATAAIGISIVYFLVKAPKNEYHSESSKSGIEYFAEMKASAIYINSNNFIKHLILISIIFFISISPSAFLTPLQTARNFGGEVWRLSAIEIAFSSGMLIAGVMIGYVKGFSNKARTIALSCFLMGIGAIALGVVGNFFLYLFMMFLIGMALPYYNVPIMVLLQTKTDPAHIGRVLSVFTMVSSLTMPFGMLLFGPLGDAINIDYLLIFSGIIVSFIAIAFVASKDIKSAGESVNT